MLEEQRGMYRHHQNVLAQECQDAHCARMYSGAAATARQPCSSMHVCARTDGLHAQLRLAHAKAFFRTGTGELLGAGAGVQGQVGCRPAVEVVECC